MRKVLTTIALLCVASSCASNARWTFHCTEEVYFEGAPGGGSFEDGASRKSWNESGDKEGFGQLVVFAVGLLLLPVAVDLVCLPVAVPHDLCFRD